MTRVEKKRGDASRVFGRKILKIAQEPVSLFKKSADSNTPQGGISTFTKFIHKKQAMNF
jgi:hypothetical protein